MTYHRGGPSEKVLAGAAFWSFGTSQTGIPLLAAMHPPMVSRPPELASQLQYCSIKAGGMVSKPIPDYAVVPDLHAAVFLVRAD